MRQRRYWNISRRVGIWRLELGWISHTKALGFEVNNSFVDLHCHSTASDGTFSPAEVIALAVSSGLSALALTDHDTIGGVREAGEAARKAGLDFLPGIEISCDVPRPATMHLLGYGVDSSSPILLDLTTRLIEGRNDRNPRIIRKLNELGVAITMEELENEAGGTVIGRPHIAAILLRKGYVSSIKQAFDKYLSQGAPAYFDKERLTARQAIELVQQSGGVAVLAHPVQLRTENDAQLERIVKDLTDLGLAGLEVMHSDHDAAMVEKYTKLADRYGLIKTGGSDFHGTNKKNINLGTANGRQVPRVFFDTLVTRVASAAQAG
jgi:predicted metal-dependent phosphoesterase TrpH